MDKVTISAVVDSAGEIQLPPRFGYEHGLRTGATVSLRPVMVNNAPLNPASRPKPVMHSEDEYLLVTLGIESRLLLRAQRLHKFGLAPGDEVTFELQEDTRSSEERKAAAKEWRQAHGIPELTDDQIAEIASDAMRSK